MRTIAIIIFSLLFSASLLLYFFSVTPVQAATFSVAASADDVVNAAGYNGSFSITGTSLQTGRLDTTRYWDSAARFTSINIPQGSTINSAYLTFTAANSDSGATANTKLHAENADNAAQITSADDFTSRTLTTGTTWNGIAAWTAGTNYNSPDISAEVQTVVNRTGWASGNAINIFWKENVSSNLAFRRGASWDNTTYTEPRLTITWTEPGAPDTTAPTISSPQVNGQTPPVTLPAGTSSATISVTAIDSTAPVTCRYNQGTDIAYSSMTSTMSASGSTYSATVSGLANGTSYTYYVRCSDGVTPANTSSSGTPITLSVSSPGGPNPPIRSNPLPSGVLPEGTTQTNISLNTNEPATCRYAVTTGIDYDLMVNGFTADVSGTTHTSSVSGLTNGGVYNYYPRCVDGVGDKNLDDGSVYISFTVAGASDTAAPSISSPQVNGQTPPVTLPAGSTSATISVTATDSTAPVTCRYNKDTDITYSSMINNMTASGSTYSATVTGLANGTSYTYYVRCSDGVTPANTSSSGTPIAFSVSSAAAGDTTTVGVLSLAATYESIGIYANFSGDTNANNSASFRWREAGGAWKQGMAMTVDRRATVVASGAYTYTNPYVYQWRASIIGVQPNRPYEVEVTFTDPTGGVSGTNPVSATIATRNDNVPLGSGNTYYVSPTGGSGTACVNGYTFQTIQRAANCVQAGDTVYIRSGTYPEQVMISRSGAVSNWITFVNYGTDVVTIDGENTRTRNISITAAQYIKIKGLRLINSSDDAINIDLNSSNIIIENNYLAGFPDNGIRAGGTQNNPAQTSNIVIQGNQLVRTAPKGSGGVEGHMISFWRTQGGHIIRNNTIIAEPAAFVGSLYFDCISGGSNFNFLVEGAPGPLDGSFNKDSDIYNNYAEGCPDDGIEIEGPAMNVRVWGNTIKRTNLGFGTAPIVIGPAYIFRNVIYSLDYAYTALVGWKVDESGTGNLYIYHNTFYVPTLVGTEGRSTTIAGWGSNDASTNIKAQNNIFHINSRVYDEMTSSGTGRTAGTGRNEVNYNLTYSERTSTSNEYAKWDGAKPATIEAFRTQTNQEINGIYGRASFADAANGNFNLLVGSLGINSGASLTGFNDANSLWPYRGTAPDMGAYEYDSGVPTDTAAPSISNPQPTGALPAGTTSQIISVTATDATSPVTCRYNKDTDIAYSSMTSTMSASGSTYSATVSGLANGTSYTYYVRCSDGVTPTANTNSSGTAISFSVSPTASTKFIIGDRVQTNTALNVRATPSTSGTLLGTQTLGARGTVTGGPQFADTYWWWQIDYDAAPDGWSIESGLDKVTAPVDTTAPTVNNPQVNGQTPPVTLPAGSTSATISVTATDATSPVTCRYNKDTDIAYSSMINNMTASGSTYSVTVTGLANGTSYTYYVRCADGVTPTANTNSSGTAISFSVSPTASTKFIIGDRVQTNTALNVRATPSTSGTLLGTQTLGARGTVTGGPQFADTYWWWQIDYDAAPDGWSIESGLDKIADTVPPSTSIVSVEGDTTPPYTDTSNDGDTQVVVSGESGMLCRWYDTDTAYVASSGNACSVSGAQATCTVSTSDGSSYTKYISCADSIGNGQTTSQNLDVSWSVSTTPPPDTTAPTVNNPQVNGQTPPVTLPAGSTSATISVTATDSTAPVTCRYNKDTDITYSSMINNMTASGSTYSATVSSLTNGTSYTYYVRCADGVTPTANTSSSGTPISFSVASAAGMTFSLVADITSEESSLGIVEYNGDLYAAAHTNPKNNGPGTILKYNDITGTYSTAYNIPAGQGLGDIKVINGRLYVTSLDFGTNEAIFVYNGSTWQIATFSSTGLLDINYYNNRYYVGGYSSGTPKIYYSSSLDGLTGWAEFYSGSPAPNRFMQIANFNSKMFFTPELSNKLMLEGFPIFTNDIFSYDGSIITPIEFTTEPMEVSDMEVFNGALYLSNWGGTATNIAGMWKTTDGTNFSRVSFFGPSASRAYRLSDVVIFNSKLYASEYIPGTPPSVSIYESSDGTNWSQVSSVPATASAYGLGFFFNRASLGVYNGRLYLMPPAEGKLYVSSISAPPPVDTTAPSISNPQPTGALPAGTTSQIISVTAIDATSPVTCRYNKDTDITYSSMINNMTASGSTYSVTVTGLANGTSYTYYVRCADGVTPTANTNSSGTAISFSVSPTASTKFIIGDRVQTNTALNVRATPSTSGTLLGTQTLGARGTVTGGPQFADTYWWWQIDYDAAPDGWSIESGLDKVTAPADTTAPSISSPQPTGALPAGTSSTVISVTAIDATSPVTCRYNKDTDIAYSSMINSMTASGTTYSATVSSLTNGTSYTYYVRCADGVTPTANTNSSGTAISFSVSPTASTKFVIGDRVQTNTVLNVRATPSTSGTLLGTQTLGSRGTVVGGPQYADTYWWWQIDYDAAPDGWSIESGLDKISSSFGVSSTNILYLLSDKANAFQVQGSNFNTNVDFYIRFVQNSTIVSSFTARPASTSIIDFNFNPIQISTLPIGFYNLRIERSSDSAYQTYTKPILITALGDIWSAGSTEVSEQKRDGKVDIYDVSRLLTKWGGVDAEADINAGPGNISQGRVDIYDANLMMKNWRP